LDKFRSILGLLLVSSAFTVGFHASSFLSINRNEINVLAFSTDNTFPLSYVYGDNIARQMQVTTYDQGTHEIIPMFSSVGYDYSGSRGISVQQDVTQLNICSSNTASCHNDIDNDFNVNPP
jgi:hypothetical protein